MSTPRTLSVRRLAAAVAALVAAALLAPAPAGAAPAARDHGAPATLAPATLAAAVRAADVPGTAWSVDPASGDVHVVADPTVTARDLAGLRERAAGLAGTLTVERTADVLRPYLRGGEPVYSGGGTCLAAFNVRAGATDYVLTAGHCAAPGGTWYTDPGLTTPVGPVSASSFPGNDYGLIRYTNPAVPRPGSVVCNGQEIDIVGSGPATVGQTVWLAGRSGCRSGTITGLNYTVNYGGGDIVSGLVRTSVCGEPGDSGAPLFTRGAGNTGLAVGILSGGSGSCATGGVSFAQPIAEVLAAYGVTLT